VRKKKTNKHKNIKTDPLQAKLQNVKTQHKNQNG